jgi:glutathione synthase/RimK-type ligase-like ATP-grasp enzyme
MQAARWKLRQLQVAVHAGLSVPDTLITTDPTAAAGFLGEGLAVVKTIADTRVVSSDREIYALTEPIPSNAELGSLPLAPTLFQRRIDKSADVRVTIIGDRVFPVQITTPSDAHLDFRDTEPELCTYTVVNLDSNVESACLRYLKAYGLRFGAFDFAKKNDGTLWFLECNPAGEWGWLEPATGLRITAALVDLLLGAGRVAE